MLVVRQFPSHREGPFLLVRQINPGELPQSEDLGHMLNDIRSDLVAELIEIHIAGLGNAVHKINRSVASRLPAMENALFLSDGKGPFAGHTLVRVEFVSLHGRQRRDDLKRGSWRVKRLDR